MELIFSTKDLTECEKDAYERGIVRMRNEMIDAVAPYIVQQVRYTLNESQVIELVNSVLDTLL